MRGQTPFMSVSRLSRRGFTIVELLIVIVVIAILATVTIVAFNGIAKQAENARFLSAIDAYQKEFMMYSAATGKASVMQADARISQIETTSNDVPIGGSTEPFDIKQIFKGYCVPGNYPATDGFAAGECLHIETLADLPVSGGLQSGRILQAFTSEDFYGIEDRLKQYNIILPKATYTTGESTVISGEIPAEEGGGMVTYNYRARGVFQYCRDTDTSKWPYVTCQTVEFRYVILGDQDCGRGVKTRTGMTEAIQQLMFGSSVELPPPPENPTVTVCTVVIKS